MVIQIHQKFGDLGEGSTHTTSDWNEEMEDDKEEENVQDPEPELEPQGLADECELIPGIVEDMEKEDRDARIMEQCGDSSDDEDDERFPVLGEWCEEGFGNPVVQDIRSSEFEYRVNEVVQGTKYRTIEDVKDAVKLWAVSLRKEFRVMSLNTELGAGGGAV